MEKAIQKISILKKTKLIYEPKNRAREYSPLALNHYLGCDHQCIYCYNRIRTYFTPSPKPRNNLIKNLVKEALQLRGTGKQVLLSFAGDPYCKAEMQDGLTRDVLQILHLQRIPTAIITKGGTRCLRDVDLFKQFGQGIKVGATLTFTDNAHSRHYEPGAADPEDRFAALQQLHDAGIRTWVSLEPVLNITQSLEIIDATHLFVDEYKVGKLNGYSLLKNNPFNFDVKPDWKYFLHEAVGRLRKYDKSFYIKNDLAAYDPSIQLHPHERDRDYLTVKNFD